MAGRDLGPGRSSRGVKTSGALTTTRLAMIAETQGADNRMHLPFLSPNGGNRSPLLSSSFAHSHVPPHYRPPHPPPHCPVLLLSGRLAQPGSLEKTAD
ncbi:unnamed protein product [Protopolystoma xenopodis]|uniref:Uncharacterized protein n=1 Tax=Protopolystoma xenopodis TaxID=117903 RepID=A0A448WVZ1_9PLAT|nr:unnamed protein product [Protopolystoma xenopodis]